jgi:DegV family protein with EDD domain
MSVRIVTDSASYLPEPLRRERGIAQVSLYIRDGDQVVRETELDIPEFYRRLVTAPVLPQTAQPAPEDFADVFEAAVVEGHDVVAVLLSGSMSSTVASADAGARRVLADHPGATITVVDSRANCMQEGFAVMAAADVAASGGSAIECEDAARDAMRRGRFLFAPKSLEYLKRGGRISGAAALLGSVLQLVPVLTAEDGQTAVAARVRSQEKAMRAIAQHMREDVERCGLSQVVVQGIVDLERAHDFAREHIEPVAGRPVEVVPVGPVIGLHVGPAVGVAYETVEPLR